MYGKNHTPESIRKISLAQTGNKNMLGKTLSEETKAKISENHADISGDKHPMYGKKGIDNPVSKPVMANFISYSLGREAAKALNVAPSTIIYRIKTNKPGYYYL